MVALPALVSGLDAELVRLGYKDSTMVWYRDSSKSVLLRVIAEAELPVVLRPRLPRPAVTLRYVRGWGAGGSPAAQGIARADVLDLRARPVVMIRVLTSRIVPPEPCPCLHHRWSMSSAATWMPPGWPAARTGLS